MKYLTLSFNNVFLEACACVSGPKEKNGPLGKYIDYSFDSERASQSSFEKGEKKMVSKCFEILFKKAHTPIEKISLCIGGDLTNQIALANLSASDLPLSFIGIYSACSTMILGMIISSIFVNGNYADKVLAFSSSNYGTSERQFRYPLEYGIFKKDTTTITVSGAGSCIIGNTKSKIRINNCTIGKVEDVMWDNVSDMGTPMAYAAYKTISNHLTNTNTKVDDYSLILTGDLSTLGSRVLKELFDHEGINLHNHLDAGTMIYNIEDKTKFMGGSGSACISLATFGFIINKMLNKKYKKVLLVGTGALHSSTSVQQKASIPIVAHALEIEVII